MTSQSIAVELLRSEGKKFEMLISGDCMEPVLQSGDHVTVTATGRYLPGDIIVFRESQGRLVAHRLLGQTLSSRGLRYMTKPDRVSKIDGLLGVGQILGKLTRNISRHRKIEASLRLRIGCIALLFWHSLILARHKYLS